MAYSQFLSHPKISTKLEVNLYVRANIQIQSGQPIVKVWILAPPYKLPPILFRFFRLKKSIYKLQFTVYKCTIFQL